MAYTTSDIISAVTRKGSFPQSSTDLFTTQDFLEFAYEELLSTVIPLVSTINEDYFIEYLDLDTIQGVSNYRLPSRASAIRSIQLIDKTIIMPLVRLYEEDKTSTDNNVKGYFVKGNTIILSPTPSISEQSKTLRIVYIRRPSKYVQPSDCAQIIDISGTTITVASAPNTMANGILVDFSQKESPYDILEMGTPIASISGTTLTFNEVNPELKVGDYISLATESCVAGIQEELVPILIQAILCSCLLSKKDDQANIELQKLENMKVSTLALLSPRVKTSDNKIINRNSLLSHFRCY